MKTLILINGSDVKTWTVDDTSDAEYQFKRRIEKEGFIADRAYLVDETNELPCDKWSEEYFDKQHEIAKQIQECDEKRQYEQLKKKYGK